MLAFDFNPQYTMHLFLRALLDTRNVVFRDRLDKTYIFEGDRHIITRMIEDRIDIPFKIEYLNNSFQMKKYCYVYISRHTIISPDTLVMMQRLCVLLVFFISAYMHVRIKNDVLTYGHKGITHGGPWGCSLSEQVGSKGI